MVDQVDTPEFKFDDNPDDRLGVEFKFPGDEFRFGGTKLLDPPVDEV
mgnify:CR=1 FL=1